MVENDSNSETVWCLHQQSEKFWRTRFYVLGYSNIKNLGRRVEISKGDRVGATSEVDGKTKPSEEENIMGKKVKKIY